MFRWCSHYISNVSPHQLPPLYKIEAIVNLFFPFSFIFCALGVSVSSGCFVFHHRQKTIRGKKAIKELSCNVNMETGVNVAG